jgi:hypothetical protein
MNATHYGISAQDGGVLRVAAESKSSKWEKSIKLKHSKIN